MRGLTFFTKINFNQIKYYNNSTKLTNLMCLIGIFFLKRGKWYSRKRFSSSYRNFSRRNLWNFLEERECILMKEHHVSRWLREYILHSLSTEMNSKLIENEFNPNTPTQILSRRILKLLKYRIWSSRTKGQRKSSRQVGSLVEPFSGYGCTRDFLFWNGESKEQQD